MVPPPSPAEATTGHTLPAWTALDPRRRNSDTESGNDVPRRMHTHGASDRYARPMASRVCWNCGKDSHFEPLGNSFFTQLREFYTRAYICDCCNTLSIAALYPLPGQPLDNISLAGASSVFESPDAVLSWYPLKPSGKAFEDVPRSISDAASEAYKCFSVEAYRAAMMLARGVVEAVAKDQGHTSGTLFEKIDAMGEARQISPLAVDTAHEIRQVGNDMAHGDFVVSVGKDECQDVLNFMDALLDEVYIRPAKLNQFRQQRQERKALVAAKPEELTTGR